MGGLYVSPRVRLQAKINERGYVVVKVNGKKYRAHRVIWLWVYETWPTLGLDHINRVKSDNRMENLREVSQRENNQNRTLPKPYLDLCYRKDRGTWRVRARENLKRIKFRVFQDQGRGPCGRVQIPRIWLLLDTPSHLLVSSATVLSTIGD